jgi:hypothetical protein
LSLVSFDVWLLHVAVGGRYGAGGFGVAHFEWLDAVQPLPTPDVYVGLMMIIGILALTSVLADLGRWARALVAISYTYGWAMSLHDSFQHHYFITLALVLLIFFPRRRSQRSSVWAYRLLGATVAIMYAYAATAKLNTAWLGGHVIASFSGGIVRWLGPSIESVGIPSSAVSIAVGAGVVIAELFMSFAYLTVPWLTANRRVDRVVLWVALAGALALHVGVEFLMQLRIGWFSYYMTIFAVVYFLPSPVVGRISAALGGIGSRVARDATRAMVVVAGVPRPSLVLAAVVGVLGIIVGSALELPGSRVVGLLVGGTASCGGVVGLVRRYRTDALRCVGAMGTAAALMWFAIEHSQVRFLYHGYVAADLKQRGDLAGAFDAIERARRYAPPAVRRDIDRLLERDGPDSDRKSRGTD